MRFPRLLILLGVVLGLASSRAEDRPNILFIFCDDLGYGDVGVFWQNQRAAMNDPAVPFFETPALDQLAHDGAMLTRHYCAAPVCAPSRASLLTGTTQGHATVRNNEFDKALDDTHTLGSVLQQAGYATAAFGKWGLQGGGTNRDPDPRRSDDLKAADYAAWDGYPTRRGFDYFYGYVRHRDGHYHYPLEDGKELWENDREVSAGLKLSYTTDLFAARTKQWIIEHQEANPDQPFFAYLAHDTPHAVLHNPSLPYPEGKGINGGLQWIGEHGRMINTSGGTYDGYMHPAFADQTWDHDGDSATAEVPWPDVQKRYANLVRRIDDTVGDLMQTLEDLGIADNTLVIFSTDNGPSRESYLVEDYNPTFFQGYGAFDGIKRDTLEGGIRVPSISTWPAKIPAGTEMSEPSGHWDWLATFADAAGVPAPAASDGVSLLPSLTGQGTPIPSTMYIEYWNNRGTPNYDDFASDRQGRKRGEMQAVFLANFKGLRYDIQSADDDFEIYNLTDDPNEERDLSRLGEYAGIQRMLKAKALQVRRPNASSPRPYDEALIPPTGVSVPGREGWMRRDYEGDWPWVPNFRMLAAGTVESAESLSLTDADGTMFSTFVKVPEDGTYTMTVNSDGTHLAFVHQARIVRESMGTQTETINLKAGWHPIRILQKGATTIEASLVSPSGVDVLANPDLLRH